MKQFTFKAFVLLVIVLLLAICNNNIHAQTVRNPKTPSIVILPSDNWCLRHHYTVTLDDQGKETVLADYAKAFLEDTELGLVMSEIGGALAQKGFVIKDAEQAVKNLQIRTAENNATLSRNGDILAESDLDIIKSQVRADILIQINWNVIKQYNGNTIQFTIESFDCYNDTRIPATISGIGKLSKLSVPKMLEERVTKDIEQFSMSLQSYYDNLIKNGRSVKLHIRRWPGWEYDLDSEFGGEPLIDIIDEWMASNAFNGDYNLTGSTENVATFEQVQIPAFNDRGRALDARNFGTQLRSFLKERYGISSKILNRGLGEVMLILGEQ